MERTKKSEGKLYFFSFFFSLFFFTSQVDDTQSTENKTSEDFVTSNLEEVGLFSWLVSVFLWHYTRRLVQTIVPDLHCAPFCILLSFPHHQLNVKYGIILQNCSEMQSRKCRNMEKM